MNYYLVSLGCAKNLVDSERLVARLQAAGLVRVDKPEEAEVIIVNTCGFIAPAKEESIEMVLEMARYKSGGQCRRLVMAGCLVQRHRGELMDELDEVDGFFGVLDDQAIDNLLASLVETLPPRKPDDPDRIRLTLPHTGYLRIAEGCSNRCAYCSIPLIRGPLVSRPMDELLAEARGMAAQGVKELVVIAQDITAWGTDLEGRPELADLLHELDRIDGLPWIRLMYLHPAHIDDRLIDTIAGAERIVPYLDIPVQHASTRVLKHMGRKVTRTDLQELFGKLYKRIPGLVIRTTFLVGFPGENKKDLIRLDKFIREFRPERFGVFTYSEEEGTPAASMHGKVDDTRAGKARDRLMKLQKRIVEERSEMLQDAVLPCIVDMAAPEGDPDATAVGRTYADAPDVDFHIYIDSRTVRPGDILDCRVVGHLGGDLFGQPVEKA
ncbi:MAG: 30S ribosomal protein S12 methylthiotransferase RimO [Planctomycetota bacterium]